MLGTNEFLDRSKGRRFLVTKANVMRKKRRHQIFNLKSATFDIEDVVTGETRYSYTYRDVELSPDGDEGVGGGGWVSAATPKRPGAPRRYRLAGGRAALLALFWQRRREHHPDDESENNGEILAKFRVAKARKSGGVPRDLELKIEGFHLAVNAAGADNVGQQPSAWPLLCLEKVIVYDRLLPGEESPVGNSGTSEDEDSDFIAGLPLDTSFSLHYYGGRAQLLSGAGRPALVADLRARLLRAGRRLPVEERRGRPEWPPAGWAGAGPTLLELPATRWRRTHEDPAAAPGGGRAAGGRAARGLALTATHVVERVPLRELPGPAAADGPTRRAADLYVPLPAGGGGGAAAAAAAAAGVPVGRLEDLVGLAAGQGPGELTLRFRDGRCRRYSLQPCLVRLEDNLAYMGSLVSEEGDDYFDPWAPSRRPSTRRGAPQPVWFACPSAGAARALLLAQLRRLRPDLAGPLPAEALGPAPALGAWPPGSPAAEEAALAAALLARALAEAPPGVQLQAATEAFLATHRAALPAAAAAAPSGQLGAAARRLAGHLLGDEDDGGGGGGGGGAAGRGGGAGGAAAVWALRQLAAASAAADEGGPGGALGEVPGGLLRRLVRRGLRAAVGVAPGKGARAGRGADGAGGGGGGGGEGLSAAEEREGQVAWQSLLLVLVEHCTPQTSFPRTTVSKTIGQVLMETLIQDEQLFQQLKDLCDSKKDDDAEQILFDVESLANSADLKCFAFAVLSAVVQFQQSFQTEFGTSLAAQSIAALTSDESVSLVAAMALGQGSGSIGRRWALRAVAGPLTDPDAHPAAEKVQELLHERGLTIWLFYLALSSTAVKDECALKDSLDDIEAARAALAALCGRGGAGGGGAAALGAVAACLPDAVARRFVNTAAAAAGGTADQAHDELGRPLVVALPAGGEGEGAPGHYQAPSSSSSAKKLSSPRPRQKSGGAAARRARLPSASSPRASTASLGGGGGGGGGGVGAVSPRHSSSVPAAARRSRMLSSGPGLSDRRPSLPTMGRWFAGAAGPGGEVRFDWRFLMTEELSTPLIIWNNEMREELRQQLFEEVVRFRNVLVNSKSEVAWNAEAFQVHYSALAAQPRVGRWYLRPLHRALAEPALPAAAAAASGPSSSEAGGEADVQDTRGPDRAGPGGLLPEHYTPPPPGVLVDEAKGRDLPSELSSDEEADGAGHASDGDGSDSSGLYPGTRPLDHRPVSRTLGSRLESGAIGGQPYRSQGRGGGAAMPPPPSRTPRGKTARGGGQGQVGDGGEEEAGPDGWRAPLGAEAAALFRLGHLRMLREQDCEVVVLVLAVLAEVARRVAPRALAYLPEVWSFAQAAPALFFEKWPVLERPELYSALMTFFESIMDLGGGVGDRHAHQLAQNQGVAVFVSIAWEIYLAGERETADLGPPGSSQQDDEARALGLQPQRPHPALRHAAAAAAAGATRLLALAPPTGAAGARLDPPPPGPAYALTGGALGARTADRCLALLQWVAPGPLAAAVGLLARACRHPRLVVPPAMRHFVAKRLLAHLLRLAARPAEEEDAAEGLAQGLAGLLGAPALGDLDPSEGAAGSQKKGGKGEPAPFSKRLQAHPLAVYLPSGLLCTLALEGPEAFLAAFFEKGCSTPTCLWGEADRRALRGFLEAQEAAAGAGGGEGAAAVPLAASLEAALVAAGARGGRRPAFVAPYYLEQLDRPEDIRHPELFAAELLDVLEAELVGGATPPPPAYAPPLAVNAFHLEEDLPALAAALGRLALLADAQLRIEGGLPPRLATRLARLRPRAAAFALHVLGVYAPAAAGVALLRPSVSLSVGDLAHASELLTACLFEEKRLPFADFLTTSEILKRFLGLGEVEFVQKQLSVLWYELQLCAENAAPERPHAVGLCESLAQIVRAPVVGPADSPLDFLPPPEVAALAAGCLETLSAHCDADDLVRVASRVDLCTDLLRYLYHGADSPCGPAAAGLLGALLRHGGARVLDGLRRLLTPGLARVLAADPPLFLEAFRAAADAPGVRAPTVLWGPAERGHLRAFLDARGGGGGGGDGGGRGGRDGEEAGGAGAAAAVRRLFARRNSATETSGSHGAEEEAAPRYPELEAELEADGVYLRCYVECGLEVELRPSYARYLLQAVTALLRHQVEEKILPLALELQEEEGGDGDQPTELLPSQSSMASTSSGYEDKDASDPNASRASTGEEKQAPAQHRGGGMGRTGGGGAAQGGAAAAAAAAPAAAATAAAWGDLQVLLRALLKLLVDHGAGAAAAAAAAAASSRRGSAASVGGGGGDREAEGTAAAFARGTDASELLPLLWATLPPALPVQDPAAGPLAQELVLQLVNVWCQLGCSDVLLDHAAVLPTLHLSAHLADRSSPALELSLYVLLLLACQRGGPPEGAGAAGAGAGEEEEGEGEGGEGGLAHLVLAGAAPYLLALFLDAPRRPRPARLYAGAALGVLAAGPAPHGPAARACLARALPGPLADHLVRDPGYALALVDDKTTAPTLIWDEHARAAAQAHCQREWDRWRAHYPGSSECVRWAPARFGAAPPGLYVDAGAPPRRRPATAPAKGGGGGGALGRGGGAGGDGESSRPASGSFPRPPSYLKKAPEPEIGGLYFCLYTQEYPGFQLTDGQRARFVGGAIEAIKNELVDDHLVPDLMEALLLALSAADVGFLRSEDEKLQGLVTIIFYIFDIDRNSAHEDEITSVSLLQSCAFKVLGILCRLEALLAFTICKMQTKETLEKYLQLGMDLGGESLEIFLCILLEGLQNCPEETSAPLAAALGHPALRAALAAARPAEGPAAAAAATPGGRRGGGGGQAWGGAAAGAVAGGGGGGRVARAQQRGLGRGLGGEAAPALVAAVLARLDGGGGADESRTGSRSLLKRGKELFRPTSRKQMKGTAAAGQGQVPTLDSLATPPPPLIPSHRLYLAPPPVAGGAAAATAAARGGAPFQIPEAPPLIDPALTLYSRAQADQASPRSDAAAALLDRLSAHSPELRFRATAPSAGGGGGGAGAPHGGGARRAVEDHLARAAAAAGGEGGGGGGGGGAAAAARRRAAAAAADRAARESLERARGRVSDLFAARPSSAAAAAGAGR